MAMASEIRAIEAACGEAAARVLRAASVGDACRVTVGIGGVSASAWTDDAREAAALRRAGWEQTSRFAQTYRPGEELLARAREAAASVPGWTPAVRVI